MTTENIIGPRNEDATPYHKARARLIEEALKTCEDINPGFYVMKLKDEPGLPPVVGEVDDGNPAYFIGHTHHGHVQKFVREGWNFTRLIPAKEEEWIL